MLPNHLRLITKADAAEAFGVSVKTIDNYIKAGKLPRPTLFVSKEYWHQEDFGLFLERTFRRSECATTGVAGAGEELTQDESEQVMKATHRAGRPRPAPRDSSPFVRQRARQNELLVRLNRRD